MIRDQKILRGCLILACIAVPASTAWAQQGGPGGPAGPPEGLAVTVLNTPLPVTGNVTATVTGGVTATVTGDVNATITQKLFFQSTTPTCDALNRCFVKFPAVPAGKVLRVTRIHGAMFFADAAAFVALDVDNLNTNVFVHPLTPFGGAYLGTTLSFNEGTDVVFAAGQIPIVEMGTTGTFSHSSFNRLGLTGELIDATP